VVIDIGGQEMLREFRDFAMRGNVIDLAVGVVIGAAFGKIVTSLVEDVIMPPMSVILGGIDVSNWFLTLAGDKAATLEAAKKAGVVTLNYGVFLNVIIQFVIVAFAIFIVIKQINRLRALTERQAAAAPPPPPPRSETLLAEIRDLLKKWSGFSLAPAPPGSASRFRASVLDARAG